MSKQPRPSQDRFEAAREQAIAAAMTMWKIVAFARSGYSIGVGNHPPEPDFVRVLASLKDLDKHVRQSHVTNSAMDFRMLHTTPVVVGKMTSSSFHELCVKYARQLRAELDLLDDISPDGEPWPIPIEDELDWSRPVPDMYENSEIKPNIPNYIMSAVGHEKFDRYVTRWADKCGFPDTTNQWEYYGPFVDGVEIEYAKTRTLTPKEAAPSKVPEQVRPLNTTQVKSIEIIRKTPGLSKMTLALKVGMDRRNFSKRILAPLIRDGDVLYTKAGGCVIPKSSPKPTSENG